MKKIILYAVLCVCVLLLCACNESNPNAEDTAAQAETQGVSVDTIPTEIQPDTTNVDSLETPYAVLKFPENL